MALYRSKLVFESMYEANIIQLATVHGGNFLPADTFTATVDDGHHVAFYSRDEWACEKVNTQIEQMQKASIYDVLQSPTFEGDNRPEREKRQMIIDEGWYFQGYSINLTPHKQIIFSGWERISE